MTCTAKSYHKNPWDTWLGIVRGSGIRSHKIYNSCRPLLAHHYYVHVSVLCSGIGMKLFKEIRQCYYFYPKRKSNWMGGP